MGQPQPNMSLVKFQSGLKLVVSREVSASRPSPRSAGLGDLSSCSGGEWL